MRVLVILFFVVINSSAFGQVEESIDAASTDSILIPAHYTECYSKNSYEVNKCTYQKIFNLIRINYIMPDRARELGLEGKSFVKFQVSKHGSIDSVQVLMSSGYSVLDSVAVKCVEKLPKMHPAVNLNGDSIVNRFVVPISIQLN